MASSPAPRAQTAPTLADALKNVGCAPALRAALENGDLAVVDATPAPKEPGPKAPRPR